MFLFRKIVSYALFVVASASVLGIAAVFLLSPGDSWNVALLITLLAGMLVAAFFCVVAWPATPSAPTRDQPQSQPTQAPGRVQNGGAYARYAADPDALRVLLPRLLAMEAYIREASAQFQGNFGVFPTKGGTKCAVRLQLQADGPRVDARQVAELRTEMARAGASRAVFVSTAGFTDSATRSAADMGVELIDPHGLDCMMADAHIK